MVLVRNTPAGIEANFVVGSFSSWPDYNQYEIRNVFPKWRTGHSSNTLAYTQETLTLPSVGPTGVVDYLFLKLNCCTFSEFICLFALQRKYGNSLLESSEMLKTLGFEYQLLQSHLYVQYSRYQRVLSKYLLHT